MWKLDFFKKTLERGHNELTVEKSTTAVMFALRVFMEKSREGKKYMQGLFVDLKKATIGCQEQ